MEASTVDNSGDDAKFREDLLRIARTTLSSKLLTYEKDYFANLAVDAVMRLRGSNNLDHIQVLKKPGGHLRDSYLEEGFLLDKTIGVGQPKKIVNAKILLANTSMDTDKIKIYGSRVRVDSLNKVAEIEEAEKVCLLCCQLLFWGGLSAYTPHNTVFNPIPYNRQECVRNVIKLLAMDATYSSTGN